MIRSFLIICSLWITSGVLHAQDNTSCKVLLPEISGSYQGDCKKGLANGTGKAEGTDTYAGSFKKGYPDGKGVYTYASGDRYEGLMRKGVFEGFGKLYTQMNNKDTVLSGIWKKGELFRQQMYDKQYEVIRSQSITRTSFIQQSTTGDELIVKFVRAGSPNSQLDGLLVQNSTGVLQIQGNQVVISQMEYPFECNIQYSTNNSFNTITLDCRIIFKIYEPGRWDLTLGTN